MKGEHLQLKFHHGDTRARSACGCLSRRARSVIMEVKASAGFGAFGLVPDMSYRHDPGHEIHGIVIAR